MIMSTGAQHFEHQPEVRGIGSPFCGCLGGVEGSDPGGFCKKGAGSLVN